MKVKREEKFRSFFTRNHHSVNSVNSTQYSRMPPKPSSAAVYQTLKSISATWPIDKLRPTLQLSGAISSASDRIFGVLPSSSTSTASSSKLPTEVIEKGPVKELDPKQLEKANLMIESLDRLLANSALKEVRFHFISFYSHLAYTPVY